MPLVRHTHEGEPPSQPHLAILTDDTGMWTAIPPGANVLIILDPERIDKIFPLVLAKVTLNKLHFVCACRDPECNRQIVYTASRAGHHLPKNRPTLNTSDEQGRTVLPALSPKKDDQ